MYSEIQGRIKLNNQTNNDRGCSVGFNAGNSGQNFMVSKKSGGSGAGSVHNEADIRKANTSRWYDSRQSPT
jgi:hypothetical protein